MIKLTDFFKVGDPSKVKIKFNINCGDPTKPAWDQLLEDNLEWRNMNAWKTRQSNNNLSNAEYLLSFAQYYDYGPQYYIFGGMYKIKKKVPEVFDGVGYDLELVDDFSEYRKRLIIKIEKPIGRDLYTRKYGNVQDSKLNPVVYEVTADTKLGSFPGYCNFSLSHKDLQRIFKSDEAEWKKMLSCVKGVYCITDVSTGKIYIGSATGDNAGIWQRWSSYADVDNLTGGNKTFEEFKRSGADYIIDNFRYSILEIFDMRTKRDDIIHREEHWKKVFKTKEFGMNN